ncbi:MAG: CapA family protein [Myxococcota bacterium]
MRLSCKIAYAVLVASFILSACQTATHLKPEGCQQQIIFEIQGISHPVKDISENRALLRLEGEISVASVGDIIPHNNVKKAASQGNIVQGGRSINNEGFDTLFENVKEYLKADVTIANYESPIAPINGSSGQPFVFNSDTSLLRAARDANINLFNIANNHIYDQDIKGFLETIENFESEKIRYIGTYTDDKPRPLFLERNGIRVAFFGFTTLLNNQPDYGRLREYVRKYIGEKDTEEIRKAKEKADIVIVYIHWGEEYKKEPDESQISLADELIEAGADIIIGGHPHILQPLSLIASNDMRIVPVAFSMGNFISNQSRNYAFPISGEDEGRTRDSAILRFKLKKYSYNDISFTVVSELYFVPLWTYNNNIQFSKGVEKRLKIYPFPITERIEQLNKAIVVEKDENRKKELLLELENLLLRLKLIKGTLGEDYVR